jgi:branched-chain amino acid transport system substrate-binding protein
MPAGHGAAVVTARLAGAITAVAAAVIIAAGCGSSPDPVASINTTSAAPQAVRDPAQATCSGKIAVMAPYADRDATDSVQMNWARVALDTFNTANGTGFQVEPVNVMDNVPDGLRGARRVIADPEVVGVVGPQTSVVTAAVGPLFDRARMVYVSPSATRTDLADGRLKGFYRVVANDSVQGPTIARFAANTLSAKTVAIITNPEPYSEGLADSVQAELDAAKAETTRLSVPLRTGDYGATIRRIPADVDVIVLPMLLTSDAQRFAKQLEAAGRATPLIGGDALFVPNEFTKAGAYVTSYSPDLRKTPDGGHIIRLYESIFGDFSTFGGPAYSAMEVIATAALETCDDGRATRQGVWAAVPGVELDESILGQPVAFDDNQELEGGRFYVYRVEPNGGFTPVG